MTQVVFEAELRAPDYWSDGFLMITEHKNIKVVKGLFTLDYVEGLLEKGIMELSITKYHMDARRMVSTMESMNVSINIGNEVYCPNNYPFTYNNETYELRLNSLIENQLEINEMKNILSKFL